MFARTSFANAIVAALGASFALAGSAAHAATGAIDTTGQSSLDLNVIGHISATCSIGSIASADLGDISQPAVTVSRTMPLSCNVPFNLLVSAANGAMVSEGGAAGSGGWAGQRGYTLTVDVPVLTPASTTVEGIYSGQTLKGGVSLSSNGGVAFSGANLKLDLAAAPASGMVKGSYSEVITVIISPQG